MQPQKDISGITSIIDDAENIKIEEPGWFSELTGNLYYSDSMDDQPISRVGGTRLFGFACGPEFIVAEGPPMALCDQLYCYEWMEKTLDPVAKKHDIQIEYGSSENMHDVVKDDLDNNMLEIILDDIKAALISALPTGIKLIEHNNDYT